MDVSPTMCPSLGGYGTPQPPWKEWSFWFLLQVSWFLLQVSSGSFYRSLLVPSTGLSWFLLQVSPGSFYRSHALTLFIRSRWKISLNDQLAELKQSSLCWYVINLQLSNQVSRRVESVEVLIKQSAPSRGGGGANRSPNHQVPWLVWITIASDNTGWDIFNHR